MTTTVREPRPAWIQGAALLGLAVPAVVAWSAPLGGFAVVALPLAALAAAVLAGGRSGRWAAGALAVWLPAAALLAGVPADQLEPGAWPALPGRLLGAVGQLAVLPDTGPGHDPWPLAAGLLLAGAAWIPAAALARRRAVVAFAVAAAPWVAGVLVGAAQLAALQGAAVVLAGLLWHAWPRTSARAAIALSVVVALTAAITAQAISPAHGWFNLIGSDGYARPPFQALVTEPTFARFTDRRSGAPMLEIKAAAPALWRMQVLDVFDGHSWRTSRWSPRLPEPAARPERVDVRVRGLRNDLVASPGAIERVEADGSAEAIAGSAWRIVPGPRAGDEYRVDARIIRADAAELGRARPPRGLGLAAYTRLGWGPRRSGRSASPLHAGPLTLSLDALGLGGAEPRGFPVAIPLLGEPLDARTAASLSRSPYRAVAALARRLAAGARTEWEVVVRVMRYLLDDNRFRYTADVDPPGRYPLADFLLRTHAGYCQHFAGAAALLLRLAGVPVRMVAGFATGELDHGRYVVRDVDAHNWIEVYFPAYGWVPLNPTPAAAPATIPPQLDLVQAGGRIRGPGPLACAILAVLAVSALAGWRLSRRPQLGDALTRLLGTPVAPSTTLGVLRDELARSFGPHTAALAAEAERARFAPNGAAPSRWTSARIARAVARDLGPWRTTVWLVVPALARPRARVRPPTGAASAGARSSHQAARRDLA